MNIIEIEVNGASSFVLIVFALDEMKIKQENKINFLLFFPLKQNFSSDHYRQLLTNAYTTAK
jgi:hypothetical protein